MTECIKLHQLEKTIKKKTIVRDISFEITRGKIVGLMGSNGSGKTTTFNMISGLSTPSRGDIYLGDLAITKLPIYHRASLGISYLPQEATIFQGLSVEENILSILELQPIELDEQRSQLEQLLTEFNIQSIRHQLGENLSGGERRRVEIARTLAIKPKFILLDEPFAGIDPKTIHEIKSLLEQLRQSNIGVVITDHNVNETLSICDYCHIIHHGELIASGTPSEVRNNPKAIEYYLGIN